MGQQIGYVPRHAAPWMPGVDRSMVARRTVDQERADRAVQVLAATDDLPASKELYQRLLLAGALHPTLQASVPVAGLVDVEAVA